MFPMLPVCGCVDACVQRLGWVEGEQLPVGGLPEQPLADEIIEDPMKDLLEASPQGRPDLPRRPSQTGMRLYRV